jgi:hypothetical protein
VAWARRGAKGILERSRGEFGDTIVLELTTHLSLVAGLVKLLGRNFDWVLLVSSLSDGLHRARARMRLHIYAGRFSSIGTA